MPIPFKVYADGIEGDFSDEEAGGIPAGITAIITEDGKIITTEDGKILITETYLGVQFIKISQLPPAALFALADQLPAVEAGATVRLTLQQILKGISQVIPYTAADPNTQGLVPADPTQGAIAYKIDGTGPTYGWNTNLLLWN